MPPRAIEGGTDGYLSTDATMTKRAETAAMIRKDAPSRKDAANPLPELLRLTRSLVYRARKR